MPAENQFAARKTAVAGRSRWSAWSKKTQRAAATGGAPLAPESSEDQPNAAAAATANRKARTETLEHQRSTAAAEHPNSMAAPVPEYKPEPEPVEPEPEPEPEHVEPAPEPNKPQPRPSGRQSGPWDAMASDLAKAAEHAGQSKAAATRHTLEEAASGPAVRAASHPLLGSSSGSEDEDADARDTEDSAFLGKVCRGPRADAIQTQWLYLLRNRTISTYSLVHNELPLNFPSQFPQSRSHYSSTVPALLPA